jgi:hypothetical protein
MGPTRAPLDYLLTSSGAALESFELSRLNRASNLRKELRDVVEDWIETEVDARLARCILEVKRRQVSRTPVPELEGSTPLLEKPTVDMGELAPREQLALPFAELIDATAANETQQAAFPDGARRQLIETTVQTQPTRTEPPHAEPNQSEEAPPRVGRRLAKPSLRRPAAFPIARKIAEEIADAASLLPVAAQTLALPYKSLGCEDETARRELEIFARRDRPRCCDALHPNAAWTEARRPREAAARHARTPLSLRSEFVIDLESNDQVPPCSVSRYRFAPR